MSLVALSNVKEIVKFTKKSKIIILIQICIPFIKKNIVLKIFFLGIISIKNRAFISVKNLK